MLEVIIAVIVVLLAILVFYLINQGIIPSFIYGTQTAQPVQSMIPPTSPVESTTPVAQPAQPIQTSYPTTTYIPMPTSVSVTPKLKCKCEEASCLITSSASQPFNGWTTPFSVTRGWDDYVDCSSMGLFTEANGWNCTDAAGTCCTATNPCPKHVYVAPVITGGKCQAKQKESDGSVSVCADNAYYNRECPTMDKSKCGSYGCCEWVSA